MARRGGGGGDKMPPSSSSSSSARFCCISHEFSKSASRNPSKLAVVHTTGGIQVCKELHKLRDGGVDEEEEEELLERCRESSSPTVYQGDVYFTYGEVLKAVDSLNRRIRRALDGLDGHIRDKKSLDARNLGASVGCNRFPQVVGVKIGPSVEYIVAVLSVLRCGEAFLPLDPLWPEDRVNSITSLSNISLVIKCEPSAQSIGSYQQDRDDWVTRSGCSVLYFSIEKNVVEDEDLSKFVWPCEDKNPRSFCYLMYTSGSTGKPKGVCGTEKGLMNRFTWMQDLHPLLEEDVLLFKTSISFIDHIQEFLAATLTCTTLVIPPFNELKTNPFCLVDILKVYCISRLVTIPSLMRAVVPVWQSLKLISIQRSLKLLVLSGEILSVSLWKILYDLLPETIILNLYGTTEVSGDCTYFDCRNLSKILKNEALSSVPIGVPIPNCDVVLYGEHQISDEGEIQVGGSCLFLGYIEDFYHGLYNKSTGAELRFSSGDFARRLRSGDFVFLGRKDRLIKINGQRISLEEIENTLSEHPDVDAAAVTSHVNVADSSYLRAYIVQKRSTDLHKQITLVDDGNEGFFFSIKNWLLKKLPLVMIPSHYVCIKQLPLSLSGKIDQAMLENLVTPRDQPNIKFDSGGHLHGHLQIIKEAFCDALLVEEIEDHDDFFSLGGNSLTAAQVAHKLGIDMRLLYLFPSPSKLLNSLFKVSWNFKINQSKRLKLQDVSFAGGEDQLRIFREEKNSPSWFEPLNMDSSSYLRHSHPSDVTFWTAGFPKEWACSFSRCNQFIDGASSLNILPVACCSVEISRGANGFMQELWKVPLHSCVDGSPLLVIKDGHIHLLIGSHSHIFLCVNALSGDVCWEVKLEDRVECSAAVTGDFSQVVVGCYKGRIYFINIQSGLISWVFQTGGQVKMQPVMWKHLMWCGSHDHMLYALDYHKQCCIYKIFCGGSIYGSPAINKVHNMLCVGTTSGRVTAISVEVTPFCAVWSYESGAPIFGSLCLHPASGNVICCLVDGHVLALNSEGSVLWKVVTGGPIFAGACISSALPSQVLICSRSGSIHSFELDGGGLLWEYQTGDPITSAAYVDEQVQLISNLSHPHDRLVCVCSSSGIIHVLRVNSGTPQERNQLEGGSEIPLVQKFAGVDLPGDIFSSPVMIAGRIFVGCRDDLAHCIRVVY